LAQAAQTPGAGHLIEALIHLIGLAPACQRKCLLGAFAVALFMAEQGQGQQGPGVLAKLACQADVESLRVGLLSLALEQITQQQADADGLGLRLGFAGFLQQRAELRLGLGAASLLQLQQGHQLQGLDAPGVEVEQLA
jgi:hypothetical protein